MRFDWSILNNKKGFPPPRWRRFYCTHLIWYLNKKWKRKFEISNFHLSNCFVFTEVLDNDKLNNAEDLARANEKLRENEELAERLSLIIKLNHRGSLTSLDKVQTSRRNSSNIELGPRQSNSQIRIVTIDGSSSTLDLLKSNLDLTHMYKLSQSSFIYCKTPVPHLHKVSNKVRTLEKCIPMAAWVQDVVGESLFGVSLVFKLFG